jgi:hypothetical protein
MITNFDTYWRMHVNCFPDSPVTLRQMMEDSWIASANNEHEKNEYYNKIRQAVNNFHKEETMKVRITKASQKERWYANRIGEVFDVEESNWDDHYYVTGSDGRLEPWRAQDGIFEFDAG